MKRLVLFLAALVLAAPAWGQAPSIILDWTAPGDDGMVGTASTYEMRWSTSQPDTTSQTAMNAWWAAATVASGLPMPLPSGTAQSVTLAGPWAPGSYFFVMKACDDGPNPAAPGGINCSLYSNVARKDIGDTTPPGRVVDLRTR